MKCPHCNEKIKEFVDENLKMYELWQNEMSEFENGFDGEIYILQKIKRLINEKKM